MEEECYFDWKFRCNNSLQNKKLINIKAKRIQNVIRCSKLYQDDVHHRLQSQFDSDSSLVLQAHKVCVEKYLHPKEVQNAVKLHASDVDIAAPSPKREGLSFQSLASYSIVFTVEKNVMFKKIPKIHQDGGQPISAHSLYRQVLNKKLLTNAMNVMISGLLKSESGYVE